MYYPRPEDWMQADERRVALFGMSGLGKTHVSSLLRASGGWFHYSVDYRIGTRYMGEHIADNFKSEAMKIPLLRELLLTDSVKIESNITFGNLAPLSAYLGKPGDPKKGGLPFEEYIRRQEQHRDAEVAALLDTPAFIERARRLYGYPNFVCDTGGSICEVVAPDDPDDQVLAALSGSMLLVWIEGSQTHTEDLIRRFDRAPKPMYYRPDFIREVWDAYLAEYGLREDEVDPDAFVRQAYRRALEDRTPRYAAMARNWGVSVRAEDIGAVRNEDDLVALIARAIEAARARG